MAWHITYAPIYLAPRACVSDTTVSMWLSAEVLSVRNDCGNQTELEPTRCANCQLSTVDCYAHLPICCSLFPVHSEANYLTRPRGARRHHLAEAPSRENSVNDADPGAFA